MASTDGVQTPIITTDEFRRRVLERGRELYRDLPWRRTRDPYAIWLSEVMLQQTQVTRVDGRWQRWLMRFPDVETLTAADVADVLDEWQGMGYNRRALALRDAAGIIAEAGEFPREVADLKALPGIGPATAAGIRAFAFNLPGVYLETNVRTVFLHELFPGAQDVPDSAVAPLVEEACPADGSDPADDPRTWYYALLDYGAYLKKTLPIPSRRSRTHTRQSTFEGSRRQKRANLVRILLDARAAGQDGVSLEDARERLCEIERRAGREPVETETVSSILSDLVKEGFCRDLGNDVWSV